MEFIDADTHIAEPDAVWEYLNNDEKQFRPMTVCTDTTPPRQMWLVGDQRIFGGAKTGFGFSGGGVEPEARDITDLALRLSWMERLGTATQVVNPSFFLQTYFKRPEAEIALCRAYNRFMADLSNASGGKLLWTIVPPLWDMDATKRELQFGRKNGGRGVLVRALEKERCLDDPYFFPMYSEAQELDLAIAVHVGNVHPSFTAFGGAPLFTAVPLIATLFNLLATDVPGRFPKLRFGFFEASSSWVRFVLDQLLVKRGAHSGTIDTGLLHEKRCYIACMSHENLPEIIDVVGPNCLVLGTDFGHTDSGTEIEAHRFLEARTDISDAVKTNILSGNAKRLFGL